MFGARKRKESQIATRSRGRELDKGRVVNGRNLHSVADCLRVDRVQSWSGPRAASLRIRAGFGRLSFVQTRI